VRRTKEDAAKTRAAIVDAALCCFERHGIAGSTLDNIAAAANCTKGAVYHHFAGKRDILRELRDQVAIPMLDAADTQLLHEGRLPALERIEAYLLGVLDAIETDPRMRQAITVMQFRCEYVDELSQELAAAAKNHERLIRAFEAAYREARKAGQLAAGVSPEVAAAETVMFLSGLLRLSLIHGKGGVLRKNARATITAHVEAKKRQLVPA
jgi:TetR/AcrR family transcriptional regulator, acrAB operon repressor